MIENRRRDDEDISTFAREEFDGSNRPKSEETMKKLRKHLGYGSAIGDKRATSNKRSDEESDNEDIDTYAWRELPAKRFDCDYEEEEGSYEDSDTFDPHAKADIATYAWRGDGSIKKNHCSLLPRNVRAIIVGKSGCGKTTFVTSLLLEPDMMDYNKLMMCGRSLHQPEYEVMRTGFDKGLSKNQVRTLFRKQDEIMEDGGVDNALSTVDICKGGIDASFFNDMNMIPILLNMILLSETFSCSMMLCWDHKIK